MKRSTLLSLLLVLGLIGLADAWYLAGMAFAGASLTCNIAGLDGCNVVAQSVYSKVFGLPLAFYGVCFYIAFLFSVCISLWKATHITELAVAGLGLAGLVSSAYFLYIQFVLIKALCIYCLGSAAVAFLLCAGAFWLLSMGRNTPTTP